MAVGMDPTLVIRIRVAARQAQQYTRELQRDLKGVAIAAKNMSKAWNVTFETIKNGIRMAEQKLQGFDKQMLQSTALIDKRKETLRRLAAEEKRIYAELENVHKIPYVKEEQRRRKDLQQQLEAVQTKKKHVIQEANDVVVGQNIIREEYRKTAAEQRILQQQLAIRNVTSALGGAISAGYLKATSSIGALGGSIANYGQALRELPSRIISIGKNAQWTGRQIMYNLSLPLALIGGLAIKVSLDVKGAWTRVQKVYGDTTAEQNAFAEHQKKVLQPAVISMTRTFGLQEKQIIDMMGQWAAMGYTAKDLATVTHTTLSYAILGWGSAAQGAGKAFEYLSTMMSVFGVKANESYPMISKLNVVENATKATMQDLGEAITRIGPGAKSLGMDLTLALIAQLRGAGVTPSTSGNAIKSIMPSILGIGRTQAKGLAKIGINAASEKWMNLPWKQKLEMIAKKFKGLTDAQKTVIATLIAGKFQYQRLLTILEGITDKTSQYNRARKVLKSNEEAIAKTRREEMIYLRSAPVTWSRFLATLALAGRIIGDDILPFTTKLVDKITDMAIAFTKLDPWIRNFIYKLSLFVLLLGPAMVLFGSLVQLFGVLAMPAKLAGIAIWGVGKAVQFTMGTIATMEGFLSGLTTILGIFSGGLLTVAGALTGFFIIKNMLNDWERWGYLVGKTTESLKLLWDNLKTIKDKWNTDWKDLPLGDKIVKALEEGGRILSDWWNGKLPKQMLAGKTLANAISKQLGDAIGKGLADMFNFFLRDRDSKGSAKGAGKKAQDNIITSFGKGFSEGWGDRIKKEVISKLKGAGILGGGAVAMAALGIVPLPITISILATLAIGNMVWGKSQDSSFKKKIDKILLHLGFFALAGGVIGAGVGGPAGAMAGMRYGLTVGIVLTPVFEWGDAQSAAADKAAKRIQKGTAKPGDASTYVKGKVLGGLSNLWGPSFIKNVIDNIKEIPKNISDAIDSIKGSDTTKKVQKKISELLTFTGTAQAAEMPKKAKKASANVGAAFITGFQNLEKQLLVIAKRINKRAFLWGKNMLANYGLGIASNISSPKNKFVSVENALLATAKRINQRAYLWGRNMIANYSNGMKDATSTQPISSPMMKIGDPSTVSRSMSAASSVSSAGGGKLNSALLGRYQAFAAWVKKTYGVSLHISSGFRTHAQQAYLYATKPGLAARPGTSLHEKGLAIDYGPTGPWNKFLSQFGLYTPMPGKEPWHIQPAGVGDPVGSVGDPVGSAGYMAAKTVNQYVFTSQDEKVLRALTEEKEELNRSIKLRIAQLNVTLKQLIVQRSLLNATKQKAKYEALTAKIQNLQLNKTKKSEKNREYITLLEEQIDLLQDKKAAIQSILEIQNELVQKQEQKFRLATGAVEYFDSMVQMLADHSEAFEKTQGNFAAAFKGTTMEMALLSSQGNQLAANLAKYEKMGLSPEVILEAKQGILDFAKTFVGTINDMYSRAKDCLQKHLDSQKAAIDKEQDAWRSDYDERRKAMESFYDAELNKLNERQEALSRSRWMGDKNEEIASFGANIAKIQNKGFFTYEDIDQMNQLRTQTQQEQRDISRQQEDWQLEDKRKELENLRDLAQKGYDDELGDKDKYFDNLRKQADDAYRNQVDALVESMQNVMDSVNAAMMQLLNGQQVDMATWQSIISGALGAIEGNFASFGTNLGNLGWGAGQNFINQLISSMAASNSPLQIVKGMALSDVPGVSYDAATNQIVINGRRYATTAVPGTTYDWTKHRNFITDPEAFKKGVGMLHSGGQPKKEGLVLLSSDDVEMTPPILRELIAVLKDLQTGGTTADTLTIEGTLILDIRGDMAKLTREDKILLGEAIAPVVARELKGNMRVKVKES